MPLVSFLVLAFILLRYANPIAARLFPTETSEHPSDPVPIDQWYVLAFTVLGVALLVWYVPLNIGQCMTYFVWPEGDTAGQFQRDMRPFAWQALLRLAMQLALGLYLVLGARGIVTILRKLRRQ